MRREQRPAARHVENNVAMRHRTVARRSEHERTARGGGWGGKVVDDDFESAEMAFGGANPALHHVKSVDAQGCDVNGPSDHDRDVEMLLEEIGGLDCLHVAAIDHDGA